MAIKKPVLGLNGSAVTPTFEDSDFTAELPTLTEYLLLDRYEDNSARQTSTLLIFIDAGVLKLCLSDRETSRTAFVTASTMEAALKALEQGLVDDTLDWRVKRAYTKNGQQPPY